MRSLGMLLVLGSLTAACVELPPPPGVPEVPVDTSYFYDQLSPYGDWVQNPSYGWVWCPRAIAASWRPYYYGHWSYTDDDGWIWVSDEEWGWATYHYGRWFFADRWYWVPGVEWAPAWVSWRYGGGFVGWAPLGPRVLFDAGVGLEGFVDDYDPGWYCFVHEDHIGDDHLRGVILPPGENTAVLRGTNLTNNYASVGGRVRNRGIPVDSVERVLGHPVPRARVVEAQAASAMHAPASAGEVRVFRPPLKAAEATAQPRQASKTLPENATALDKLAQKHAQEKADLETRHTQEIHNPPKGVSIPQLKVQHQAEHQALNTRQAREVQRAQPPPPSKPHH